MRRNPAASATSAPIPSNTGRAGPRGRAFLVSATLAILLVAASAAPAAAASNSHSKPGPGGTSTTGSDISWPQCGGSFPSGQAFGIVGVNDGLANTPNPCLGRYNGGALSTSELVWAWGSQGSKKVPTAALYVNTANPSPVYATVWPNSGTNIYGTCDGSDSQACAWEYGKARAAQDIVWLEAAASEVGAPKTLAADYTWWLDVETGNSWETGTQGLANNVADLQGMVDTFTHADGSGSVLANVGIYSTSYQWGVITGGSTDGNLLGLPNWIPGARRLSSAQSNCALPSFTNGAVLMTQWFGQPYDGDWAC